MKQNPFLVALLCPVYLLIATTAIVNDFLLAAMFIMFTLGLIGAYVTEFPMFDSLYMNEVTHKVAVSSLLGILIGMLIGLGFAGAGNADPSSVSPAGKFMMTWGVMCAPGYPLMVFLIHKVNGRDLEAEQAVREAKKKKRGKSNHPPILNQDKF